MWTFWKTAFREVRASQVCGLSLISKNSYGNGEYFGKLGRVLPGLKMIRENPQNESFSFRDGLLLADSISHRTRDGGNFSDKTPVHFAFKFNFHADIMIHAGSCPSARARFCSAPEAIQGQFFSIPRQGTIGKVHLPSCGFLSSAIFAAVTISRPTISQSDLSARLSASAEDCATLKFRGVTGQVENSGGTTKCGRPCKKGIYFHVAHKGKVRARRDAVKRVQGK